jgi:hypothetical protein
MLIILVVFALVLELVLFAALPDQPHDSERQMNRAFKDASEQMA